MPNTAAAANTAAPAAAPNATTTGSTITHEIPRSEEDITQYVLFDGLPLAGPSMHNTRERQTQAYLQFVHRIRERVEAAHAVVLSANPLSLAVMASQLRMYRWRVTEAQTLLETTSVLQDLVMDTAKHGYRVRRRPAAPRGVSRYAHGRGAQALRRIAQREREKLEAGTDASDVGGARNAAVESSSLPTRLRADGGDLAADVLGDVSTSSRRLGAAAAARGVAGTASVRSDVDMDVEADTGVEESTLGDHEDDRLPLPPPDALPRLVLVDGFTHEDFAEIARHVRFVDTESGLELLLVLLLPADSQATAVSTQGAGVVVTPAHETSVADAYAAGYDLVLAHNMDNLLVDFLTSAFVSSVGRWRNDIRSKAAVGNYMSVRNVLLGGLDTASLQRLVWDDNTDDAEVLELLGAQSLSTQGGAKRFGEASRQLLGQQQQQQQLEVQRSRSGDVQFSDDDDDTPGGVHGGSANAKMKRGASNIMSHVPRLRSRPASVAHFGVRLPVDKRNAHAPLNSFGGTRDVLGGVMTPATHGVRGGGSGGRRRHHRGGSGSDDGGGYGEGAEDDQRMLQGAMEQEMGRLMAENDGKQASIDSLEKELESLHRTVHILKRHVPGGGSVNPEPDSLTARSVDRPDSGSMMHLAKQQQIYILKERLEAANGRIVALLRDEHSNESQTANARNRGGGSAGLPAAAARRAAAGSHAHSSFAPNVYRRRAYEAYHAAREGEMMTLLDEDAQYVNATLAQMPQVAAAAADSRITNCASSAMLQRKEREATDQVLYALQAELRTLQGRLDSDEGSATTTYAGGTALGDLQARMAIHLQSAVDRLEAERQRVRHLEELRQTDRLLLAHAARLNEHVKRELSAAKRAEEVDSNTSGGDEDHGDGDAGGGGGARRRSRRAPKGKVKPHGKRTPAVDEAPEKERAGGRKKAGGAGAAGGSPGSTAQASRTGSGGTSRGTGGGGAAAATFQARSKGKQEPTDPNVLNPEQVEGLIAAAVTDAVAARNRVFQRQLGALVQTCRTHLARVVLKHKKPRTIAYVQMLHEELHQAELDQRAAFMRLQFTLTHLRPDQYDATSVPPPTQEELARLSKSRVNSHGRGEDAMAADEESGPMIPLRAVTDADVRRAAERVAREHAAYAMRAAYMSAELQRVQRSQDASASTTADATPDTGGGGAAPPSLSSSAFAFPPHKPAAHVANATTGGASVASISATAVRSSPSVGRTTPPRPASAATAASLDQLLRAHQQATQQVKQVIDTMSPVHTYLDAVQAEMEAETRLSPWCDVDCERLFEALPTPSSNAAVAPAPHLALVPTNLHHAFPSASEFTVQSLGDGAELYLPDLDGSMRDMADVYGALLRSFVSLGEGLASGFGYDESAVGGGGGADRSRAGTRAPSAGAGKRRNGRAPHAKGGAGNDRPSTSLENVDGDGGGDESVVTVSGCDGETKPRGRGKGRKQQQQQRHTSRSLAAPGSVSLCQAFAQLPLDPRDVPQYPGRLDQLYSAVPPFSRGQRRLYEVLLQGYQQRCINPLHMAGVEATVLTAGDATTAAYLPFSLLEATHTLHREVVGLLLLLLSHTPATPALCSLVQQVQETQPLLEREAKGVGSASAAAATSARFLAAVDTALLGCLLDELRWRRWQMRMPSTSLTEGPGATTTITPALDSTDEDMRRATLVEALAMARAADVFTPTNLTTSSPLVSDLGSADMAADPRVFEYYAQFCAARVGLPSAAMGGLSGGASIRDDIALLSRANLSGHPDDIFHFADLSPSTASLNAAMARAGASASLASAATTPRSVEAYRRLVSLLPRLNSSGTKGDVEGQMAARDLALCFGRQRAEEGELGGGGAEAAETALLRDIYMDDGSEGGGGDANTQAIRRLRMELEYMETLRRQRMVELATRCDWRLQGRSGDPRLSPDDGSSGDDRSGHGSRDGSTGASAHSAIDPDRLNFALKSGTSAWYGMEAAKRVRAILRRRARPDQIIVGGGPDGGGVGIELSRRTAQPAVAPSLRSGAPQSAAQAATAATAEAAVARITRGGAVSGGAVEDENGYTIEDVRDARAPRYERRSAPSHLPSVTSSYQSNGGCTTAAPSAAATRLPPLRHQGESRAQYQQQGVDSRARPIFMEPANSVHSYRDDSARLQQQYVSPRDTVSLSAYANLATAGYDDRVSGGFSGAEDLGSRVMAYRAELTRAAGRLSPSSTATYANGAPYCLPVATPPRTNTATNLARTRSGAGQRSSLPQQTTWVYGVPTFAASNLLQQQSTVDPSQPRDTVLFMPPRARSSIAEAAEGGRQQQQLRRFSTRFPTGVTAPSLPYSTPAAMAAQRLQSMLTASMADASVLGPGAAAPLRQQQQQQERGGGPSSASTTPRVAPTPSLRSASAREPSSQRGSCVRDHSGEENSHAWEGEEENGARVGGRRTERSASQTSEKQQPTELDATIGPGVRGLSYAADNE